MSKKIFSLLFLLVVLVGTLVACKSTSVPVPTNSQTHTQETKIFVRDTIFKIEKDSSIYKALLECQEGKVVVKANTKTVKGKYLQPPKVIIKDNYISVDCEAEAQKLFAQWKEVYQLKKKTTIQTNTVLVEKELTFWQKVQIWCGRIFLLLLLIIFVSSFLRWRNII